MLRLFLRARSISWSSKFCWNRALPECGGAIGIWSAAGGVESNRLIYNNINEILLLLPGSRILFNRLSATALCSTDLNTGTMSEHRIGSGFSIISKQLLI